MLAQLIALMLPSGLSVALSPSLNWHAHVPVSKLRAIPAAAPLTTNKSQKRNILLKPREYLQEYSIKATPHEVTMAGVVTNIALSGLKAAAGCVTGSASLIADAGHSLSDLLSDGLALLATSTPAWERQCTYGIAAMLGTAGLAMVYHSGAGLLSALSASASATGAASAGATAALDAVGLLVVLVSIASKEALFFVTHAVGKRVRSTTLVANAHHHRSDAMSSIAAAFGICGALAGFRMLDALAALVVGAMVCNLGRETFLEAVA